MQKDEAPKDGQKERASEEDVRHYRVQKRRATSDESDDGEALRAQLAWEGRKQMEKGKY